MNGLKLALILSALLVASAIAGWDEVEWVFYSGLSLLVIAYLWSRASLVGVGVARTLDADRVFAGDEVRERFRVANRSILPKGWISVVDRSTLPGHSRSRSIAVRRRSAAVWTNRTKAVRRGRYRLGPLELRSGDPFGLFGSRRDLDLRHELIVYPKVVSLPDRHRAGGDLGGGMRIAPGRSSSSPVIRSLRQYVIGDPWNHIAWRASARHGSLLVKELEPDPVTDEWILLDLAPFREHVGREATEYAVSLAASFALEWLGLGRDVGLMVNRAIPAVVEADAGDRQRLKILEMLAVVEPYGEGNAAALLGRFAGRFSRATGLIVISTGGGGDLVAPVRHLRERGVPIIVYTIVHSQDGNGWREIESAGIAVTRLTPGGDCAGIDGNHTVRQAAT